MEGGEHFAMLCQTGGSAAFTVGNSSVPAIQTRIFAARKRTAMVGTANSLVTQPSGREAQNSLKCPE